MRGVGLVGAFGTTPEALRAALADPPRPGERGALTAETARLEEFVSRRELRRVDHFSRLALLGAHLALADAGAGAEPRDRLAVVVATGYGPVATTFGFLDSVIDGGDACASPTHFSNSVHNAAAAHVSILLGATGPSLTVSQFELSTASALVTARQWLAEGRVDAVLFGAVDEHCGVREYCWERSFGPPKEEPPAPLDLDRQSAVPGEGAAFLLLTRDEGASPACGFVEAVEAGPRRRRALELPEGAAVVLGADGHRRCAAGYRRLVPAGTPVAAWAAAYGSTPAGAGLDLAAAALCLRDGRALPTPSSPAGPWPVLAGGEVLAGRPLCCLKVGWDGAWGLVTLRKG
ncbi:MAG: beta-ketoacyl synthase chain length factor [Deltaproteobacteria bacterium]|nr:beta-ketoacyl synthase chain length factor [Deltaproteobacteria bacterium]